MKFALPFALAVAALSLAACNESASVPGNSSDTPVDQSEAVSSGQDAIEAEIIGAVTIEGEPRPTLEERMAHFGAAQFSVAVWRGGALDWAEGYGEGADTETLFQAASLSKAVAATGIVTLAMERGVSLDEDISGALDGLDLAAINPEGVAITLRGLLSHTNGATVGGFRGYAAGLPVPTNKQVIEGAEETNSDPVRIEPNPDGTFSYSGGGFQIAQYWAETVSSEDFAALMDRLVLEPVGMSHSTFEQPLPGDIVAAGNIGPAYGRDGKVIEGKWHIYPEQAAAGLWTTPSDYGRFAVALSKAMKGETGTGISPDVAAEVTTAVSDGYGLGIGVEHKDGEIILRHSGSNEGYKTYFEAWPGRGDAIVVMSGSPGSFPLNADVVRTAKQVYGWPMGELTRVVRVNLYDAVLTAFEGDYAETGSDERAFTIEAVPPELKLVSRWGASYRLVPIGDYTFVDPDDGQELSFETADDGTVTISSQGKAYMRLPAADPDVAD